MVGPVALQGQDQSLERALRAHMGIGVWHGGAVECREGNGPYSPHHFPVKQSGTPTRKLWGA